MFENSLTNCIPVSINSLKSKDFEPSESSALLSISFMSIILYHTAMYTIITLQPSTGILPKTDTHHNNSQARPLVSPRSIHHVNVKIGTPVG